MNLVSRILTGLLISALFASSAAAQSNSTTITATRGVWPNLKSNIERPLRYRPEGADFVIENGEEFFNRPLYGGNTAFRVDAGDKPEFTLYLPGRGGNLRLGLKTEGRAKWLHEAERIVTRYRPGSMLYEVRDPLLGNLGVLNLSVLAMHQTDGLIVRALAQGVPAGVELVWAYGGVNGQRGSRDGDIGTERVPISEYFQLRPEFCRSNFFALGTNIFALRSRTAIIAGLFPTGANLAIADAAKWSSANELLASIGYTNESPVVVGREELPPGVPRFFALQRIASPGGGPRSADEDPRLDPQGQLRTSYQLSELPSLFAETEAHFRALRERVRIETPDPFLNAAAAALNVATDAVWDEPQGAVMHGAIAWRSRLLGWRGPYAQDALGWHERARRHFTYWAGRQNTNPIPDQLPLADTNANLARSERALHSNGDMSNSHYDMNAVYVDALFRHLLWTGDLDFARAVWPVIQRHLAWERRLFRREFGAEKLPLYEAYAMIWASDDLQYHGGGATHASAYNYYHNLMAARLAKLLGADASSYEREAELIARGMREFLWLPEGGGFAEFKDSLGLQLVHPNAALWTFYHAMDSGLPTPQEAWQMTRKVDREMPHMPVRGQGVPSDQSYEVLSSSSWMPYTWSINNVVMGENIHTALGYWQAGRAEEAFRLTKSALLASMFMGICPGNVGSMNYLDVYRRESQRDFADGGGVTARALIEGLFGVKPDLLAGELTIRPGFPSSWERASLRHPEVSFTFRREGDIERFDIKSEFAKPMALRFVLPMHRQRLRNVTINHRKAAWKRIEGVRGYPVIEASHPAANQYSVEFHWGGARLMQPDFPAVPGPSQFSASSTGWSAKPPASSQFEPIDLTSQFNDRVTAIFQAGKYGSPRSRFVSLALPSQGIGAWAGHVNATAEIDDRGLRAVAGTNGGRFMLPNGVPFATPGPGDARNIVFTSQWNNYPRETSVALKGRASRAYLLMAGSSNHMQSRLDNGEIIVTYTDGSTERLALHNPTTWWPIDQDYFIDDFAFQRPEPIPPRVDLRTGIVRLLDPISFKGKGGVVRGGAANVLDFPLRPEKELKTLTVRALANEVVIGLMAVTLVR